MPEVTVQHATRDAQPSDPKIGQDLVKTTIALFLSFALGLKMDALNSILKSIVAPSTTSPWLGILGNPDFLLTLAFFFTWFSFFLGTNFYMSQPPAGRKTWRFDLLATMITLGLIVFLGATASVQTIGLFVFLLFILYVFEFVWECTHLWLEPPVPSFWFVADVFLAGFTFLFWWFFPSWPLWWLVLAHFVYAMMNLFLLP